MRDTAVVVTFYTDVSIGVECEELLVSLECFGIVAERLSRRVGRSSATLKIPTPAAPAAADPSGPDSLRPWRRVPGIPVEAEKRAGVATHEGATQPVAHENEPWGDAKGATPDPATSRWSRRR